MEILYQNLLAFDRYDLIMIGIGCLLVYLAISKEMVWKAPWSMKAVWAIRRMRP